MVTASPFDAHVVSAALDSLASPRHSVSEAIAHVPNRAGLYAVYAHPQAWDELGLSFKDEARPLYVGKAERSLVSRDLKTHFATGKTGSSTLRRSFAALLRESLGLRGVPRNLARPERPANFGLSSEDDHQLTRWMHERLSLAVWVKGTELDLDALETTVLDRLRPPLNIAKMAEPSRMLRDARRTMANDARARAASLGFDI